MVVGDAVIGALTKFLIGTLRRNWCSKLEGDSSLHDLRQILLDDLNEVKEDLSVLRGADRNVASMRFVRGVDLLLRQSLAARVLDKEEGEDSIWKEDIAASLDAAEHGYHRVKTIEEKIMCFEIMCSCFLLLRSGENAIFSIIHSIKVLTRETHVENALQNLKKAVQDNTVLSLEDCALLELYFSRVCTIIAACEMIDQYSEQLRDSFRALFRGHPAIAKATDPASFARWGEVRVYKYSTKRRIAEATAHAVVPIVPVMAAVGTIVTAGYFRPKNAGITTFNTITLRKLDKDSPGGKLLEFRWSLLDLAHCKASGRYQHGRVSLTMDSNTSSWLVVPSNLDLSDIDPVLHETNQPTGDISNNCSSVPKPLDLPHWRPDCIDNENS